VRSTDVPATLPLLAEHRAPRPRRRPLTVALAQLAGPWLDARARFGRLAAAAELAREQGAGVVAYPETYLSGYPFWLSRTGGAAFDDPDQKACYAYYLDSAVEMGGSVHRDLEVLAADVGITLLVGLTERGVGAGRGSTWCTLLTVDPKAGTVGHHRKLVPTYDERLVWSHGDGAGLRVHEVEGSRVGSLNCWENWMPQARSALYGQGEEVHVGAWPGSSRLTSDITRFVAAEGRVFSAAVSGLLGPEDVPADFPLATALEAAGDTGFDGGTAVAAPDGTWLVPPQSGREGLVVAELDPGLVDAARLTFDPTGHYARPDVFHDTVDRRRRAHTTFLDGPS
jgi:nitrilase